MTRRILLLGLVSALALVLGFVSFTAPQAVLAVRYAGYWIVLVATVWFGYHLGRSLRSDWPAVRAWRTWWRPGLVLLAATVILHVQERHEFKIVADEVVLQLTAQRMHFAREAGVVLRGYDYAGNFTPFVVNVDKRPLFFPFLLSLVHDFTGYRVGNAFVLNAALSLALMALAMLVARRIGGWGAACAAVLLLAGVPLVAQSACGSGFDLLNLVMILLVWWLGLRYADEPQNDDRLAAFVLGAILLAQVRYESVLFLLPVGATLIYLWRRSRQIRLPAAVLAAPLLLLVVPWQYNVFKVLNTYWQLNDVQGATSPFGLQYFYENVGHAMNFFLCFDGTQPNSWLVGLAGTLGVGFFVLVLYRHHRAIFRDAPVEAVHVIFLVGLVVHTGFMLCYFWGRWDDPVIRRLSLPAHLLLVFSLILRLAAAGAASPALDHGRPCRGGLSGGFRHPHHGDASLHPGEFCRPHDQLGRRVHPDAGRRAGAGHRQQHRTGVVSLSQGVHQSVAAQPPRRRVPLPLPPPQFRGLLRGAKGGD